MKNRLLFTGFILIFNGFITSAQQSTTVEKVSDLGNIPVQYDRASITLAMRTLSNQSYNAKVERVLRSISIPDKFNDHKVKSIQTKSLWPNDIIARQVIAKWFNRNDAGNFNMELIKNRGVYNATDADYLQSSSSKRGKGVLEDAGERLLNKSYIMVLDFTSIETMPEYYSRMNQQISDYNRSIDEYNRKRKSNEKLMEYRKYLEEKDEGYMGEVNVALYQIQWNDSVNAVFYNEIWIEPNDSKKESKINKFNEFEFPLKFIGKTKTSILLSSNQDKAHKFSNIRYLSDDELFNKLVEEGIQKAYSFLENNFSEFEVTTSVYSVDPIIAKIGLKEGVHVDQRYFVYEFVQNKKGIKKTKRKGVVRATSNIDDNRYNATGFSKGTNFYQVSGRTLEKGMFLKQKNDKGIGITAAYGLPLLNLLVEYNMGPFINIPGLKIFGELSYQLNKRTDYVSDLAERLVVYESVLLNYGFDPTLNTELFRYAIGLSKDFHFGRNFVWIPFIAYSNEEESILKANYLIVNDNNYARYFEKDQVITKSEIANLGMRLGINLRHNIQLLGSAAYSIRSIKLGDGLEVDSYLPEPIKKPKNYLYNIGLRLQF